MASKSANAPRQKDDDTMAQLAMMEAEDLKKKKKTSSSKNKKTSSNKKKAKPTTSKVSNDAKDPFNLLISGIKAKESIKTEPMSTRVPRYVAEYFEGVAGKKGVSTSKVLRELLTQIADSQLKH